jgi:tRNA G10  N-methylase Trm11
MERTPNELDGLIKDSDGHANKETPIWILNIISAINTDVRYGRTTTIDGLFDRLFGKAIQSIEADIATTQPAKLMSEEEIQAEIDQIDKELKK